MKFYISLNIKVISQYQFVCTRLSSEHTPTRKLVGVWALDKLVHTNRYYEITYIIDHMILGIFCKANKTMSEVFISDT